MKKLLVTCAIAIAGVLALGTANAQYSSPSNSAAPGMSSPQNQTMPQTAPSSPSTQNPGMQGQSAQSADLTGQSIYSAKGTKIGTVSSMTIDSSGQQAAVVNVQRFMGMGGKNVTFPVSSLQARTKGGYMTNLTATEIKALPEYKGGGSD
jgi:hypothetical protein